MFPTGFGERAVKKSVGQAPLEQRHAVIEHAYQEKLPISIRRLCELLEVNRAWDYAKQHQTRDASKREEAVARRDAIEEIVLEVSGYGYRRVTHALQRAGWKVNHKRVHRIMGEESGYGHLKRHFVRTTDSRHPYPLSPNLVNARTPDAQDSDLGGGFYLHPPESPVRLPGDHSGCLFAPLCGVECVDT